MAIARPEVELIGKDSTQAAFDSVKRRFGDLSSSVAGLRSSFGLISAAISAAITAVSIKHVSDYGEELAKSSQKTGIAVESFAKLRYAAHLADVDTQGLAVGLKTLATNVFENDAAFKALGISTRNSSGQVRSLESVLGDVSDAFSGMEDGAGKSALAVRLFGRAGQDMIPFLNQGREAIRAAGDEAQKFGLVLGADTAARMQEFNDNLKRLGAAAEGAKISFANSLLPALNDVIEQLLKGRALFGGWISAIIELGTINPFKTIANNISEVNSELTRLQRLQAGDFGTKSGKPLLGKIPDQAEIAAEIDLLKKRREFLQFQQRQNLPQLPASARDETARFGAGASKRAAPNLPDAAAEAKRLAAEKATNELLAKLAVEQFKRREDAEQAADDAFYEMVRKGIEKRADLRDQSFDDELESIKELNKEKEKLESDFNDLLARGALKRVEQADELREQELRKITDATKEATEAGREFGLIMTSAFGEMIKSGGSARDMIKALGADIAQLITKMTILKPLEKGLESIFGGGGGLGGIFDRLFSGGKIDTASAAVAASWELPKFATGTPFVPRDMIAMVHKGEEIIPAGQNRGGGMVYNVDMRGASVEAVSRLEQFVGRMNAKLNAMPIEIMDRQRRGGSYSFGSRGR